MYVKDVFISIRGRVLINVEALNMTESVGNYIKHRRVPIMMQEDGGSYTVYFMPAISGESIAHGFQKTLSEIALENGLPICKLCSKGIFLKSSNKAILKESFDAKMDEEELERGIIESCVIEDVGGFLYAEKSNVKRTSNFYTGYMIPTRESLRSVVIEPQLQSRYALGTKFVKREETETQSESEQATKSVKGKDRGQMLYYVETSSAVYTFALDIDTRFIGRLSFKVDEVGSDVINANERGKRIVAVLEATKRFLIENGFGAKKTRFLPANEWESMVIAASDSTWTVPSPFTNSYIEKAQKKKEKISYNTDLYIFSGGSLEEFVADALEKIKARVSKD